MDAVALSLSVRCNDVLASMLCSSISTQLLTSFISYLYPLTPFVLSIYKRLILDAAEDVDARDVRIPLARKNPRRKVRDKFFEAPDVDSEASVTRTTLIGKYAYWITCSLKSLSNTYKELQWNRSYSNS
ncbi:hypothetical protein VNO77_42722 [Canavalia gladiata]|uniref:Uncharacterized protein n=1 Tax=Canavalia gladiata TaxID=3824 RepID=A0AAN9JVL0_CANGL